MDRPASKISQGKHGNVVKLGHIPDKSVDLALHGREKLLHRSVRVTIQRFPFS